MGGALALAATASGFHPVVLVVSLLVVVAWAVEMSARPRYSRWTGIRSVFTAFKAVCVLLFVGMLFDVIGGYELRLGVLTVAAGLVAPLVVRMTRRRKAAPVTTLLVGDRISVTHLLVQWQSSGEVLPVGVCLADPDDDIEAMPSEIMGVPVLGRYQYAAAIARDLGVERVVVESGPVLTAYVVRRIGWALEQSHIEIAVAAEIHGAVPRRTEPRIVGGRLVLSVRPPHQSPISRWVKAALDRCVGTLMLVLLSPLLLVLLVLVRRETPGPGLFRQERIGRNGRPFTMYKLRTMEQNAEERRDELVALNEGAGLLFKVKDDPRVTRLGRFLRKTSLDELPQLINVVRGEMSLIGPRPALPREVNGYDDWIRRRLTIRPGMTGLWQVSGRSSLPWNQAVRLDLDYVDNWSLLGDAKIAAKTVDAVFRGEGAS